MSTERVKISYGETVIMEWDGAQASAPIYVDGEDIGYQTADARHRTALAVRLAASKVWGPVYETREDAEADGRSANADIVIWEDLEYETLDEA